MALETEAQDNGSKEDDGGAMDSTATALDSSLTHLTNNTKDTRTVDAEENPAQERDCLSAGRKEKLSGEEERGDTWTGDAEENPAKERDCLSAGHKERLGGTEERGDTDSDTDSHTHRTGAGGNLKAMLEGSDLDPLSVDLYERLRAENGGVSDAQWDDYNMCDDLRSACKRLSCSEKQFYAILMSIFAAMTFAMVFGLFVLQAQITWNSHEIITQVQSAKKELPEGMYNLYFDYLESGQMPDNVDLRANTTIFVH